MAGKPTTGKGGQQGQTATGRRPEPEPEERTGLQTHNPMTVPLWELYMSELKGAMQSERKAGQPCLLSAPPPPPRLPRVLLTMFPFWALSAPLTSALPILSNQKSSHNLESQTIVFLLSCSIAPGKYLFILYLTAFLFQALRNQDLAKP